MLTCFKPCLFASTVSVPRGKEEGDCISGRKQGQNSSFGHVALSRIGSPTCLGIQWKDFLAIESNRSTPCFRIEWEHFLACSGIVTSHALPSPGVDRPTVVPRCRVSEETQGQYGGCQAKGSQGGPTCCGFCLYVTVYHQRKSEQASSQKPGTKNLRKGHGGCC